MTTDAPLVRRPRADAERNRRRVLDAASRVFAERGPAATLGEVAEAAGVGIATVYRNYPDREALLDALFADKIDTVLRVALEAAELPDPGEAFRTYLLGIIEVHAQDRSLATVLFGPGRFDRFPPDLSDLLGTTADGLIDAAVAAGELRAGFTRQDTVALAVMVSGIAPAIRDVDPGLWRRYAALVVDGTRPSASPEPLSPEPPPFRAVAEAMGRTLERP